jgi:hypothetical protein
MPPVTCSRLPDERGLSWFPSLSFDKAMLAPASGHVFDAKWICPHESILSSMDPRGCWRSMAIVLFFMRVAGTVPDEGRGSTGKAPPSATKPALVLSPGREFSALLHSDTDN